MSKIVNLILIILFSLGTGYTAKKVLNKTEEVTLKRIKKGLSSSESFARQLSGQKLNY